MEQEDETRAALEVLRQQEDAEGVGSYTHPARRDATGGPPTTTTKTTSTSTTTTTLTTT